MKALSIFLGLLLFSEVLPDQKLNLATSSTLSWKGSDVMGNSHRGTILFSKGWISLTEDGVPLKGEFEVDMNTIRDTDIKDAQGRADLESHLKNEDFFDVPRFPKAMFQITSVKPSGATFTIQGFLAIKGIINMITFPATIAKTSTGVNVKATVSIDRTKWGVMFQSQSVLANLKDGAISDTIEIGLDLNFTK